MGCDCCASTVDALRDRFSHDGVGKKGMVSGLKALAWNGIQYGQSNTRRTACAVWAGAAGTPVAGSLQEGPIRTTAEVDGVCGDGYSAGDVEEILGPISRQTGLHLVCRR